MTQFAIHALRMGGGHSVFLYDNETSSLTHEDGTSVIGVHQGVQHVPANVFSVDEPGRKAGIKTLKISLGLLCNYECSYCSQRFVPHAAATNPTSVESFVAQLLEAKIAPERIEFWGGEPLVYWKTLKPLAERLRGLFPDAVFVIITNGSLLDQEKNEWLDRLGFNVAISHDGPGYHVRGQDPLDNPAQREAILDLYRRLHPKDRISINAMMHSGNTSRAAVQKWLQERFGDDVPIGEGSFIDPYDEGGIASTLQTKEEHIAYRRTAYAELRNGSASNFDVAVSKIREFVQSIEQARPASSLGSKCAMEKSSHLAVDLNGNVVTCQNVSAASVAPNGQPHKIGHINDLSAVELRTSTHWSKRPNCKRCPVLQLCKGSCMFLEGGLFKAGCNASFTDNIPFLAAGIEFLTGAIPYYIEGEGLPEDRKDIFGQFVQQERRQEKPRRVIPIVPM